MKAIIAITMLLFLAVPAMAEEKTDFDLCYELSELAGVVMEKRQEGISMGRVMGAMLESGDNNPIWSDMVIRAYEEPRMQVPENQRRMIQDFKNQYYLECVKVWVK